MEITRKLVDFCHRLNYGDLAPEVTDRTKYLTLDFLGVASRGSIVESTKAMYGMVEDLGLDPRACGRPISMRLWRMGPLPILWN